MEKIPQPRVVPILGNAGSLNPDAMVQSLVELANKHGPIFRMTLPGQTFLVVSSQELVNEVCDEKRFDKKIFTALENVREFAGDGLFTSATTEPNWGIAHRILMPVLGPQSLRGMYPGMLDIAEQLILKWERQGPNFSIDIVDNLTRLTLDTIALCAFGYRFNSFYEKSMHPFIGAMVRGLVEAGARTRRVPMHTRLMLLTQRQFAEDVRVMHELADELIAEKRKLIESGSHEAETRDILSSMITARDPLTKAALCDENIRYQMVTFLIAGHETTSGLLSFAVNALLDHPEELRKARSEVDRVLGRERPRYEHLQQLTYLDQILKETLRLWPTAPAFAVAPRQSGTVLAGRYLIEPKEFVLVLLPQLHRDEKVWGPSAAAFDPERMAPEKYESLPPNAWKPFGNGQRACIGRPFAMQEALLALALILQRFDIQKDDPNYRLKIKETLTLKPDGLHIRATKRAGVFAATSTGTQSSETHSAISTQKTKAGSLPPLQIRYGSNCGSSEEFANKLASLGRTLGHFVSLEDLNSATQNVQPGLLIIVTASYEGQPCDNARKFVDWLKEEKQKRTSPKEGPFKGVQFAVLGCGNRDWARTYQSVPKEIDSLLDELGGSRFHERGEADARGDFFGDFDRWAAGMWSSLAQTTGEHSVGSTPNPIAAPHFEIRFVPSPQDQALKQNHVLKGTIVKNTELVNLTYQSEDGQPFVSPRSKRHIEIALPEGVSYKCGDYLAVMPVNGAEAVDRVLTRFGLVYDTSMILSGQDGAQTFLPLNQSLRVGDLISTHVELNQPVTRKQLAQLAQATACPPERKALEVLCEEQTYVKEVLQKRMSALNVLETYESCELSFASFLQMLQPLRPRQYSISSSPLWSADHCSITVAIVHAPAWTGNGKYTGVTSHFLSHAAAGTTVGVMPRTSNPDFCIPENLDIPMVMVCAGSGLAPFRGFLQERSLQKAAGKSVAECLLFFGCDHPEVDYLYKKELEDWQTEGVVRVFAAFSSGGDPNVRFVQDRIWKERSEVVAFFRKGARAYVCGDGKYMAPAVRETFGRIYSEMTQAKPDQVEAFLLDMEHTTRYVVDVFS